VADSSLKGKSTRIEGLYHRFGDRFIDLLFDKFRHLFFRSEMGSRFVHKTSSGRAFSLVYQFFYQFDRKKTRFVQFVKNNSGSEKTQKPKKTGSYH
jgi:hypothetical protein